MRIITPLALALSLAIGCGGSAGSASGGDAAGGAPSAGGDTTQYEGPLTSTNVDEGKETFETFCGDCHPDGEDDVGPSLIENTNTPASIRQQIREGSGRMRPFSAKRLSDQQVEDILAWMSTINAVK